MKKTICLLTILLAIRLFSIAQNVGIGTNAPASMLHVNKGTVLFSGLNYFTPNPAHPPIKGKGTRTFWYAEKAAFRTGGVFNDNIFGFGDEDTSNYHNWDRDSIGLFSFAAGFNTKAKGDFSIAMGNACFANGTISTAFGNDTKANGSYSFTVGKNNKADGLASTALGYGSVSLGNYSAAIGQSATSSGNSSIAMGANTEASGKYSTAFGIGTFASGDRSTSMGDNTLASGDFSTAMGTYTIASGDYSTAMGKGAKASGYASLAAGNNTIASGANSSALGVNANTGNHTNSFCIAGAPNDLAATNTSDNQMMMRFNNYTFWVSASNYAYLIPASNGWAYTSDKNKKERFVELNGEGVLKKISTIPFYSWNFKASDTKQYRHYGIMAQDFYSAFGHDDYGAIGNDTTVSPLDLLGVAYSAIKALEKRTESLQEQNNRLTNELATVNNMKAEMEKLKEALEAIKVKIKN